MDSKPPNVDGVKFLTPAQIEEAGLVTRAKQEKLRKSGKGFRYFKIGQQIRVHPDDLAEWLAAQARFSTSDKGSANAA